MKIIRLKALLWLMLMSITMVMGAEQKKPNILFVFSDQQAYDMLGCYGNEQIITPNLDKFAEEGLKFNNFFSNNPICTPFRGMLMSGKYSHHNGTLGNDQQLTPGGGKKFGEVLRDAGYYMGYIGKWHLLGGDRDRNIPAGELRYGFDDVFYSNNCHVDFRAGHAFYWDENDQKQYFDKWEVYGQTDQALQFLDNVKDKEEPFALFVSWHPPHDWGKFVGVDGKKHYRYDGPEELMAYYNRDSIKVRPGMTATPDLLRMYHGHMATVTGVDIAFGQLMDKLKAIGADDNTLIVFTSDHGDMLEFADAQLPKQYPHDYSTHIPFLLRYPEKITAGQETDLLFSAVDVMPTILGLMDLDVPAECEGKNLAKSVLEEDEDSVDFVPIFLLQGTGPFRGVVTKDFTFAYQYEVNDVRKNVLFDRKNDPYQLNNLINDPAYAAQVEQLKGLTHQWMHTIGDDLFLPPDYSLLPERLEGVVQGDYVEKKTLASTFKLDQVLWDFEATNTWKKGENCSEITTVGSNAGMGSSFHGRYFAHIAGTSSTYAMKSIYIDNIDLDLSKSYFQGCFGSYNYAKVREFQIVFKFYSEHHLLCDTIRLNPFPARTWSLFSADISDWAYANHITKIEIGRLAPGEYVQWGGIFMLDYLGLNPIDGNTSLKAQYASATMMQSKNGNITIVLPQVVIKNLSIACYELSGQKCNISYTQNNDEIILNTEVLQPGMYVLTTTINERRYYYKFLANL